MATEITRIPMFPMKTEKQKGFTCSVTDFRYLNPVPRIMFESLVEKASRDPEATDLTVYLPPEMYSEEYIRILTDVLLGVRYEVKKRGWGAIFGCILVGGITRQDNNITIHLLQDHVKAINEFMQGKDAKNFSACYDLIDLVKFLAVYEREEHFDKATKEETNE